MPLREVNGLATLDIQRVEALVGRGECDPTMRRVGVSGRIVTLARSGGVIVGIGQLTVNADHVEIGPRDGVERERRIGQQDVETRGRGRGATAVASARGDRGNRGGRERDGTGGSSGRHRSLSWDIVVGLHVFDCAHRTWYVERASYYSDGELVLSTSRRGEPPKPLAPGSFLHAVFDDMCRTKEPRATPPR